MKRFPWVAPAFALVYGAGACERTESATRSTPVCGHDRSITETGIGAFAVGVRVDLLRSLCIVERDSLLAMGAEGLPERRLTVLIDSLPVSATIDDDRVWRIEVGTPRFRTADGIMVGSPVSAFAADSVTLLSGEGNVALVTARHCGLSFLLNLSAAGSLPNPHSLGDSVRVREILIVGCKLAASRPA